MVALDTSFLSTDLLQRAWQFSASGETEPKLTQLDHIKTNNKDSQNKFILLGRPRKAGTMPRAIALNVHW